MKAYRFKRSIVEIQPYEELRPAKSQYNTTYLYRGCDEQGRVKCEIKGDRARTVILVHPSNLWDVMVREN